MSRQADIYDNDWLVRLPDVEHCAPETLQRARIAVCDRATSVDDAKQLLDMLGLL